MSGFSPKAIIPIENNIELTNTEHGTLPSTLQTFKPFKLFKPFPLANADMSSTMSGCSPKAIIPIEK